MPIVVQYRTVAVLAALSALATIFYLSEWTRVYENESNNNNEHAIRPQYRQPSISAPVSPPHWQPPAITIPYRTNNNNNNNKPVTKTGSTDSSFVTDKNARIAAMNSQAFVRFCNSNPPSADTPVSSSPSVPTFSSYNQWIEFINHKNAVNPAVQPTEDNDTGSNGEKEELKYLDRPLRNWIVNLTAIAEPCDRRIHSSAHCLNFLTREHQYLIPTRQTSEEPATMNFHIFWRGPITDKLSLSSFSFLFTQPLDRSHLHLWIDSADLPNGAPEDYTKNKFAAPMVTAPLNQFITIHAWDQAAEIAFSYPTDPSVQSDENTKNGINNKKSGQEPGSSTTDPVKPVALSDEARFLILNRHGGIYLDADVLLLKDMSPFFDSGYEFAYEWSSTGMYNTAILRLFPNSSVARRILDGAKTRELELLQAKLKEQRASQEDQEEENDSEFEDEVEESLSKKASGLVAGNKPRRLAKREMRPEEIYHPARLRAYLRPEDGKIEGNGLIMMSTPVFDPLWLRVDHAEAKKSNDPERMIEDLHSFPDAFSAAANAVCPRQFPKNDDDDNINNINNNNDDMSEKKEFSAGPEVFLTGAYAHHWHNNWMTTIDKKSWMGLMRTAFDDFVEGRRPNLYGEWFRDVVDSNL